MSGLRALQCLLTVCVAGAAMTAGAQGTGTISGIIRDSSGAPVAGASIALTGKQSAAYARQTSSSQGGSYVFSGVPAGDYIVKVEVSGYTAAASPTIHVTGPAIADITLEHAAAPAPARPKLELQASGLRGLIDPGGYSASTQAAAASGLVRGIADIKRTDRSFRVATAKQWPCELEPSLRKAVEQHPEEAAVHRRLGEFYVAHQEPLKALPLLTRAVELDGGDVGAAKALAAARLESGQFAEARAAIGVMSGVRDTPEMHQLMARAYEGSAMFPQAAEEYRIANKEEASEESLFGQGYELLLAASLKEALAIFEAGEQQYRASISMRLGAGAVEVLLGHTAEGTRAFLEAADLGPDDARPYAFLASVSGLSSEESGKVRESFRKYYERQPGSAFANYFYAASLAQEPGADRGKVEQLLTRSIGIDPQYAKAHLELANLFFAQDRYGDAVLEYDKALQLDAGLSEAHYHLALAYKRLNRAEDSAREMQIFQQEKGREDAGGPGANLAQFISALDTPVAGGAELRCGAPSRE